MNRFVRNNLLLIVVIACSCVAAVVLFVFSLIRYVGMTGCMKEIEEISRKVKTLGTKNPSPHNDNRKPLEENAKIYNRVADDLAVYFTPELKKIAENFVRELVETNPPKEDGKIVPLTVERFRDSYNEMWSRGKSYVDKQFNYQGFRDLTFRNWHATVKKYLPIAQKYTLEPLNEDTLPEMLFSYIGIPRSMGEQAENMVRFMKNYQNALVNAMTGIKFNTMGSRVDWFGFPPDPTALDVLKYFNNPAEHYPRVAAVWDIYGDVIKRMVSCAQRVRYVVNGKEHTEKFTSELKNKLETDKINYTLFDDKVESFFGLCLRAAMTPPKDAAGAGNEVLRNAVGGDEDSIFKVYRMRIQIGGTMEGIRTFIRSLDSAYLDHLVYVVRSVALYAERDGAFEVFKRNNESVDETAAKNQENTAEQSVGRGRGRGRGRAVKVEEPVKNEKSKAEAAAEEARRREQEEAAKKLKFYERYGYGDVIIGDDKTCKAVIDFDYYVLK